MEATNSLLYQDAMSQHYLFIKYTNHDGDQKEVDCAAKKIHLMKFDSPLHHILTYLLAQLR